MYLSGLNKSIALITLLLALFSFNALANSNKLDQVPFEYYAEGEPVKDVLAALATSASIGVNVSSSISEDFNGHLQQVSARGALDYLSQAYDLIWYFDNSTLYVYKSAEMQSQIYRLKNIDGSSVKHTMEQLNLWDSKFDWRAVAHSDILMVSGPPRYIELVTQTVSLLEDKIDLSAADPLEIRIFKLVHASAIDRKFSARGEDIVIPGVATMLANMTGSNSSQSISTAKATLATQANELAVVDDFGQESTIEQPATAQASLSSFNGEAHPLVQIQAEPSLNAIIIQDYRSRIRLYEELISQLDVPRQQLEISLVIIDMSANSLQEIGVDWQIKQLEVGKGLVDLILPGATETGPATLTKTNKDFLATVTAVESQGQARVMSRPAVVTENGIQAVLDNNETFYVRVQGERVAELEAITYGTMLQVTPRIVETGEAVQRIYLDLNIEDGGQVQDNAVDSLPTIKNTQISTRASVPEGASLLIGGYYREGKSFGENSVPLLGDIPFAGELFKHNKDTTQQLVRLFMISPKIITPEDLNPEVADDLNQAFSFSQQLTDMASVSNTSSRIFAIDNLQPCETSMRARQRRNDYSSKGYGTAIKACRDLDGKQGFRLILSNCPKSAKEPECRI